MKLIQDLSEMIDEEIIDAHKYAKCAKKYKDEDPELSRTFAQLANEELSHMERLHTQVVRIIKDYREKHGDPPATMMTIYNYLHERQIEKVAAVRMLLA